MKTKEEIIEKYKLALEHFQLAQQQLRDIYLIAREQGEMNSFAGYDALEYADNVLEIITCDHGQAGLTRLIEKIE